MTKELRTRVISAVVALTLFIPVIYIGGVTFQLVLGLLAMLATAELMRMYKLAPNSIEGILAMLGSFVLTLPLENYLPFLPTDGNYVAFTVIVFILMGSIVFHTGTYTYSEVVYPIASSFYIGVGFHNLALARMDSLNKLFFALLLVWATDIGAYMLGRQFGKRKLAPLVSPNKSIEGFIGGIASAVVVAAIYLIFSKEIRDVYSIPLMLVLAAVFSVVAQFGDLVESAIKRRFGVKDSGNLIPGHGGILDRFDSVIFVFPIMHFFGLF